MKATGRCGQCGDELSFEGTEGGIPAILKAWKAEHGCTGKHISGGTNGQFGFASSRTPDFWARPSRMDVK